MTKRLISGEISDFKDGRKVKKRQISVESAAAVQLPNAKENIVDALPQEYQPQFANYMLIGDLVAIMILHSKNLLGGRKWSQPLYQHFCHSTWSVSDLLNELKSKKGCYPIAKNVILSVGYNDYCNDTISALLLVEGIEKIITKLRKRGCEDILLTNVPPAAAKSASVEHWRYLQTVNAEISRLCEKYKFVGFCNIFKLFGMPKNYFTKNKDYVSFGEITYKVDTALYSEHKRDMISFNDLGKTLLGKHIASSIENRLNFLRQQENNRLICTVELSDSEDVEVVSVKKRDRWLDDVVIDVDAEEDNKDGVKVEADDAQNKEHPVNLFCTCKNCTLYHQKFLSEELEETCKAEV